METYRPEELRNELNRLLNKQAEVLKSRVGGEASDTEIVEFEIRQQVIQELCNQLAHRVAG